MKFLVLTSENIHILGHEDSERSFEKMESPRDACMYQDKLYIRSNKFLNTYDLENNPSVKPLNLKKSDGLYDEVVHMCLGVDPFGNMTIYLFHKDTSVHSIPLTFYLQPKFEKEKVVSQRLFTEKVRLISIYQRFGLWFVFYQDQNYTLVLEVFDICFQKLYREPIKNSNFPIENIIFKGSCISWSEDKSLFEYNFLHKRTNVKHFDFSINLLCQCASKTYLSSNEEIIIHNRCTDLFERLNVQIVKAKAFYIHNDYRFRNLCSPLCIPLSLISQGFLNIDRQSNLDVEGQENKLFTTYLVSKKDSFEWTLFPTFKYENPSNIYVEICKSKSDNMVSFHLNIVDSEEFILPHHHLQVKVFTKPCTFRTFSSEEVVLSLQILQ